MKRTILALALLVALVLPGMAKAEGTGMYLAPKFLMTIQVNDRIKKFIPAIHKRKQGYDNHRRLYKRKHNTHKNSQISCSVHSRRLIQLSWDRLKKLPEHKRKICTSAKPGRYNKWCDCSK